MPEPLVRQPEEYRTDVMPDTKACSRCKEVKPWHQFGRHISNKDGLSQKCMPCERIYQKEWRDRTLAQQSVMTRQEVGKERSRVAKEKTRQALAVAKGRMTRADIEIEEPPEPTPLASFLQMFQQTTTTTTEADETSLRFQLASRMLDNQQEILKLLLGPAPRP